MTWKFWKKEELKAHPVEDLTRDRNLVEKLANMEMGHSFAVTTRDGIRIFRYVELRTHPVRERK